VLLRFWLSPAPLVTYPHPKYLTALRPGEWRIKFPGELPMTAISINPLGFRGHRSAIDEPRRVGVRIAVLGDSFTFGYGVDDDQTWPKGLEECLCLRTGRDVFPFNLGVPGTAADQHYLRLSELSATLAPQVVIEVYLPHLNTLIDHEWIEGREGDLVGLRLRTGLSVVDSSKAYDLVMKAYRVMRDSLLSVRAYFKTDVHLTPSGNRYFGDLVCRYLIEQGVPARSSMLRSSRLGCRSLPKGVLAEGVHEAGFRGTFLLRDATIAEVRLDRRDSARNRTT
jgi:hypothetical protein